MILVVIAVCVVVVCLRVLFLFSWFAFLVGFYYD